MNILSSIELAVLQFVQLQLSLPQTEWKVLYFLFQELILLLHAFEIFFLLLSIVFWILFSLIMLWVVVRLIVSLISIIWTILTIIRFSWKTIAKRILTIVLSLLRVPVSLKAVGIISIVFWRCFLLAVCINKILKLSLLVIYSIKI